jgi:hypothetical protein
LGVPAGVWEDLSQDTYLFWKKSHTKTTPKQRFLPKPSDIFDLRKEKSPCKIIVYKDLQKWAVLDLNQRPPACRAGALAN